jgi:glycine/D-amino acid oxidase-like deaminating enzyme
MDADVIVVGVGLAGLVATHELTSRGKKVALIDQENAANLGGQAFWSFGGLFLVDSPEQRRLRVKDPFELAWNDWQGSAQFDRLDDGPRALAAVRCLIGWGDEHYAPAGPRLLFVHTTCGREVNERGVCPSCDTLVAVADLSAVPGSGLPHIDADADPVTAALARPHRMLEPVDPRAAHRRPDDHTS